MEMNFDHIDKARQLIKRAMADVPEKNKAVVLLESARVEEYALNIEGARSILAKARQETKREWKVFLESVLLEMRANDIPAAIQAATDALKIHSGTGRLWAVLIQLKQPEGEQAQMDVFRAALKEVPKSGEVWAEGARLMMNPLSLLFHLPTARKYINFAIQFTPQYGDSFIEYLRLELLETGCLGILDSPFFPSSVEAAVINQSLEQLSVNADPNYGALWFHCKKSGLDSTRQVLRNAKELLIQELYQYRTIYQQAILRSTFKIVNNLTENDIDKEIFSMALSFNTLYKNITKLSNEDRRKLLGVDTLII